MKNWCATCEDICSDHPSVCTICGDTLQVRHVPNENNPTTATSTNLDFGNIVGGGGNVEDVWENSPVEAMDPTAASPTLFPTSTKVLKDIPRIVLKDENSSFFYDVSIHIYNNNDNNSSAPPTKQQHHTCLGNVTVAEFGPSCPYTVSTCSLVPAPYCLNSGRPTTSHAHNSSYSSFIKHDDFDRMKGKNEVWFMQRGGGITFVKKALAAQEAGASAVICANNVCTAWPYIMKDSTNEAIRFNLQIPIVMISKSDGHSLLSLLRKQSQSGNVVTTTIQSQRKINNECVICCDDFTIGQTVIRLPSCNHVFHEKCALRWLSLHNNCPYCRKELPTDNTYYEEERRRRETSQINRNNREINNNTTATYASWNSLFG